MSPARRGFYILLLKNYIFYLRVCSILHGCYNISLLIKETVKYKKQNHNTEGKILVEFPYGCERLLFTKGAAISNLITRCVQNSVLPNISGMWSFRWYIMPKNVHRRGNRQLGGKCAVGAHAKLPLLNKWKLGKRIFVVERKGTQGHFLLPRIAFVILSNSTEVNGFKYRVENRLWLFTPF